jgi:hypothetical protein
LTPEADQLAVSSQGTAPIDRYFTPRATEAPGRSSTPTVSSSEPPPSPQELSPPDLVALKRAGYDPEVFAALPEDLRKEVLMTAQAEATSPPQSSAQDSKKRRTPMAAKGQGVGKRRLGTGGKGQLKLERYFSQK